MIGRHMRMKTAAIILAALVEGKAVDAGLIGPAPQFLKLLTIAGVKDADEGPLV